MKILSIDNLVSQVAQPAEPWRFKNEAIAKYESKAAFLKYRQKPGTKHLHFSAYEGLDPKLRVSESNKAVLLHGLVVDYDAKISDAERASVLDRVKADVRPQWVSRTFSSGARLTWAFEEPVCLPSNDAAREFLKLARKKLSLSALFPGLDDEALCSPATYYEVGTDWVKLSEDVVPKQLVWQWMAQSGERLRWDKEYVAIPIDKVAEEVEKQYPGRWQGLFELGSRGMRFWDPTADNESAAIVRESGMQCFTGSVPFIPWAAIVGRRFVEAYEANRLGAAIALLWFDGREYWLECGDGRFQPLGREDTRLRLKSRYGLKSNVPRGETCSEVDHALRMIQESKWISCAAHLVHKPSGIMTVNGQKVLNISTVRVVKPSAEAVTWGKDFPWIAKFLDGFFAPSEQLDYFLAWLKRFYVSALERRLKPGQAIFLCGEREQGKNLLSNVLVSKMLGGHVDAADYLTGQTRFAGRFFESALWTMDDVTPLSDTGKHRHYTAILKKMVANRIFSADEKFRKVQTVEWSGRIIVTTNLDPESIRILPALDVSNQDKLCLFRVQTVDRKFPEDVATRIAGELPAFCRWLVDWDPPVHVQGSSRYGVKSYIEESLLTESRQSSDSAQFEELLGAFLKEIPANTKEWEGTATDLMAQLSGVEGFVPLLRELSASKIGRQLAKLQPNGYLDFERSGRSRMWKLDVGKFWEVEGENLPF